MDVSAGALDRVLLHRGRHGSASLFIGLAHVMALFLGCRCGLVFGIEPNFGAGRILGTKLGVPVEI
jgi:hypothetical protein